MRLHNYARNEYGKCDHPLNTVQRIKEGFDRLGLQVEYAPVQASSRLYWGRIWIEDLQIVCEGKGITPELAKASAYAELTERISAGLFYPVFEEQVRFNVPALYSQETLRFLHYEWMEGYIQAHQDELTNPLSLEALLAREDHLRPQDIQEMKASPMAQHWITAYSLVYDKEIHVPINFVSYIHGSNGMAAGNTLEEALIQACCEIFERYSQIEIIKSETVVPTLSEETIDSPLIQEMMDFYRANNVRVMLKDLSLNEHLPSVGVLFLNDNLPADRLEHRMLIPGASFYGTEGLTRCFTEGVQGRQNLDSPRPQLDRSVVPKEQVANYYLLMRCGVAPTDISFLEKGEHKTYRPWQAQDIMEEIEAIKSICRQFNTDCILVNHTHPVIDMPVVRVVIPKISDFLPFLGKDILVSQKTRPSAAWQGEVFQRVMKSFFPKGNN